MKPDRRHIPDPGRRASITPRSWWDLRVPLGVGLVALLLNGSGLTLPQPQAPAYTSPNTGLVGELAGAAPLLGRKQGGEEFICWFPKGPLEKFCVWSDR